MRRITLWLLALSWLAVVAGCTRLASEEDLHGIVQSRLDAVFQEPVLRVSTLRRLGSSPLASQNGVARRVVYYNVQLEFLRDYALSDWQNLNAASLAALLGAAERGVSGIEPDGNQAGDILRVRGSISFEEKDGWQPIGFVAPATALPGNSTAGTTAAEQRIAQISSMLQLPGAADPAASRAIAEELDAAHRRIVRRLDRLERALIIAGGPEQGEYHLVAQTLAAQLSASGMATRAIPTQGSLENIGLLERGEADLILVQSDIAAMAYRGQGFFAGQPPRQDMRAIASLFPEALHIVVRQDSPITSVAQLAGKRVDLGLPDSGTRASARAVLAAYGLQETHLQSQPGRNIDEAAQALKNDEIDAFFAVISAPSRRLQALAAEGNMRLLNLHPEAIQTLQATHDSFVALNLAAGTYPGQSRSVATVAVTALLAARADMPAAEVRAAIKALFEETDFLAAGSTAGGLISVHNATKGLTLPPHAEALPLLSNTGPHHNRVPGVPLSK